MSSYEQRRREALERNRQRIRDNEGDNLMTNYDRLSKMTQKKNPGAGSRGLRKTDPLTLKRLSHVPALSRVGYIAENQLDRKDAKLLRENPDAFNRKVGGTITQNLKWRVDSGIPARDPAIEKAVARTKVKKNKKSRDQVIREEREQKEMERLMAQQNSSLSASGMMGGAEYGQDNKWRRNVSSDEVAKNQSSSERIRDAMRKKKDRVR